MRLFIFISFVFMPFHSIWASQIFHLESKNDSCQWKLYDVEKHQEKSYYQSKTCPNQIVWLKDKSFYFSIGSQVFWSKTSAKKPIKIVDIKSARLGYDPRSEVIWGVKGHSNAVHVLVIDPHVKRSRVGKDEIYKFRGQKLSMDQYRGIANEPKAAGIIRRWSKSEKKWQTVQTKLVGRFNESHFDEDLYSMSVLSSRQIIGYNECGAANCDNPPSESFWSKNNFEEKLKLHDNGIESVGYLTLEGKKGLLFKKSLDESVHTLKPFILCDENCEKMTELELPDSFSDNYSLVKKGHHLLISNENRGNIASLYNFDSPKPLKEFKGPMVFWHPF